jgi:hypothetical protein
VHSVVAATLIPQVVVHMALAVVFCGVTEAEQRNTYITHAADSTQASSCRNRNSTTITATATTAKAAAAKQQQQQQ